MLGQSKWSELQSIPDKEGFAGLFAGVSNGTLICAGGANFPDKKPWEGGIKQWYNSIYLLESETGSWKMADEKLPISMAYGCTVSYKDQVIIIGGNDAENYYNNVIGIEYRDGKIVFDTSFPELPETISNMSGVLIDGVIYIAGGKTSPTGLAKNNFYILDLKTKKEDRQWIEGPTWPGASRIQSVSASHNGDFYLISGFDLITNSDGGFDRILLKDAYRYHPGEKDLAKGAWTKLPDLPRGVAAAPSPAFNVGLSHIVIPGGLDKETLEFRDPSTHPGFKESVIAFNVSSNEWVSMEDMPKGSSRVTAPTVFWKDQWIIPNGESGPGIRSAKIYAFNTSISFGWQNWLTLVIYLGLMLLIGFYFSRREVSTSDYFLAGGRIPWWAAGISIYGTQLSAITFMAIPAIVYATDWRLAVGTIMILAIVPLIVKFYLPVFRKMNITTAYEYLETRFDFNVRVLGSLTFILLQLGRMGVVLYLPSIAIASVTGIDIILCIVVMGIFSTIYTVLGGIEAVIWTDVIQVFVLMGGALACIFVAVSNIDGGVSTVINSGIEHSKFLVLDWRWDYTQLVFWVAIIGFFFLNLISYSSDQVVIQRYLTVKTEKDAAQSLWTNGLITLPGIIIFFGLGTTLFVYYLTNPTEISSETVDEILPYFVVTHLPLGIAGLVISGIFAASMSSLDSSMNSIATAYITDFHKRFWPNT
jgi:SSS family transporter